jgi:enamine deaminase RidA (YjgF/YER057c/UK114 family)
MSEVERALASIGIALPAPNAAAGRYMPAVRCGSLLFVSGQTPKVNGKVVHAGRLESDQDISSGRAAARLCAANVLAQAKAACNGDLSLVKRCVRVGGFVQSGASFHSQSSVIDAASDVFLAAFGEAGRHARTSIGVSALPGNAMVEVEAIFEIEE